ncbi:hypothetical protein [Povalibacter sp.]|uniref:hypothetical protein n=1 Tax=Povalibacter sp. TaxID=1962978 RepID=UPI002F427BF5
MATIRRRRKSDGTLRYTAQIHLRKGKFVVHSEAKTFMHCAAAEKWAKAREVALESPGELARSQFGDRSPKKPEPLVHRRLQKDLQMAANQTITA